MKRAAAGIAIAGVVAALIVVGLNRTARTASPPSAHSISDVVSQCASSVDSSGFGRTTVSDSLQVLNQKATISVSCTIHVLSGASITIANSQLATQGIIISDDGPGAAAARVQISNSSLIGASQSVAIIQMRHPADSVAVNNGILTYPGGLMIAVGGLGTGTDMGGGNLQVANTKIKALDPQSQGIRLLAGTQGGTASFANDDLQTPDGQAILWAGTCQVANVTGAVPTCSPPPGP